MLIARQAAWLRGAEYRIEDAQGRPVGEIEWPMFSQASNARLRVHAPGSPEGRVRIVAEGRELTVEHEYLSRDWQNDTRYTLRDAAETALAVAELRFEGGLRRGAMRLVAPCGALFVRRRGLRRSILLQDGDTVIGRIRDRRLFSIAYQHEIDLPDAMEIPVQLFVCFLAVHLWQTQA